MAYNIDLTNEWTEVTLNSWSSTSIQNQGTNNILYLISATPPVDLDLGNILEKDDVVTYRHSPDIKLYVRALYLADGETQRVSVI